MNLQKTLGMLLLFVLSFLSVNTTNAYTQLELLNDGCKSDLTTDKYPSLNSNLLNVIGNIGTNLHKKYVDKNLDEQISKTGLLVSVLESLYNNKKNNLTTSQRDIILSLTDLFVCKKVELEAKKNGVSNIDLLNEVNESLGYAINYTNSGTVKNSNCKYDQCFEDGYYVINENNDFDNNGKKEGCNESGLEDAYNKCILMSEGQYISPTSTEVDATGEYWYSLEMNENDTQEVKNRKQEISDCLKKNGNKDGDLNAVVDCYDPIYNTKKTGAQEYCANLAIGGKNWVVPRNIPVSHVDPKTGKRTSDGSGGYGETHYYGFANIRKNFGHGYLDLNVLYSSNDLSTVSGTSKLVRPLTGYEIHYKNKLNDGSYEERIIYGNRYYYMQYPLGNVPFYEYPAERAALISNFIPIDKGLSTIIKKINLSTENIPLKIRCVAIDDSVKNSLCSNGLYCMR